MPCKKKATPGSIQFNKLIDQLPEKEIILKHNEFKNDFLEPQTRSNYKNEFDRLQGSKNRLDWMETQNQECKKNKRKQGNH